MIVSQNPPEQLCSVTSGSGTVTGNISDIAVNCYAWLGAQHWDNSSVRDKAAPQVVMNKEGQASAIWISSRGAPSSLFAKSYSGEDGIWPEESIKLNVSGAFTTSLFGSTRSMRHLALNDNGHAIAVWQATGYNTTQDGFGRWQNKALDIVDSNGTSGPTAASRNLKISINNSKIEVIEGTDGAEETVERADKAIVVWTERETGGKDNYYTNTFSWFDKTWGLDVKQLNSTGSSGTNSLGSSSADIALNNNNQALAIWPILSTSQKPKIEAALYVANEEPVDPDSEDPEPVEEWQLPQTIWQTDEIAISDPSPNIAINDAGEAVAIWAFSTETKTEIWVNTYSEGEWAEAKKLHEGVYSSSYLSHQPEIAINEQGKAIAVWAIVDSNDATTAHIYADTYSVTDQQWDGVVQLDEAPGNAREPRIALADNGLAIAVWEQEITVTNIVNDVEVTKDVIGVQARGYSTDSHCWCGNPSVIGTIDIYENTALPNTQPDVAINEATGESIIVWSVPDKPSTTDDDEAMGIWANHFSIPQPQ